MERVGRRGVELRRPGPAVRRHHQPLAHLQGDRSHLRIKPVLASTCSSTTPLATWRRSTCLSSSTRTAVRHAGLSPRLPHLLPRAGDRGRSRPAIRRKTIAERSHQFRPLGLGYANLGTLLMVKGSLRLRRGPRPGRRADALMTGEAYALSAEMAASKGPFPGYTAESRVDARGDAHAPTRLRQIDRDLAPAEHPRRGPRGLGARRTRWARSRLSKRAGDGARAHRHHRPA